MLLELFGERNITILLFSPGRWFGVWCYKPRNTNVNGTYVNYCLDAPGKGMKGWVTHIYVRIYKGLATKIMSARNPIVPAHPLLFFMTSP